MTREVAIKAIQDFIGWFKEDSLIRKALDMAIKALEHPEQNVIAVVPCGDCISRQAVLKLKHHKPEYGDMIYAFDVEQLPSVTQKSGKSGKWIHVSERLPEDGQEVLYSTKTGRVFHGEYYDDNTDRKWFSYKDDMFSFNNVVNAWMPLPKPYEPQESEDQE